MLRRLTFMVAVVLALAANTVSAQVDPSYQTANGLQTLSSMTAQLRSAGYGGPWDESSISAAYARTTGGAVNRLDQLPSPPPGAVSSNSGGTAIVMLPGLDNGSGSDFSMLYSVFRSSGLGGMNYLGFSYNEPLSSAA